MPRPSREHIQKRIEEEMSREDNEKHDQKVGKKAFDAYARANADSETEDKPKTDEKKETSGLLSKFKKFFSPKPKLSRESLPGPEEYTPSEANRIIKSVAHKRLDAITNWKELIKGDYAPDFAETDDKAELRAQQEFKLECADIAAFFKDKRSREEFAKIDDRVRFAEEFGKPVSPKDADDARMYRTAVKYAIIATKTVLAARNSKKSDVSDRLISYQTGDNNKIIFAPEVALKAQGESNRSIATYQCGSSMLVMADTPILGDMNLAANGDDFSELVNEALDHGKEK